MLTSANAFQNKYGHLLYPTQANKMPNNRVHITNQNPGYNFSGKTVLIVDDLMLNLILLEIYFKNTGASILFANNGMEAMNICLTNPLVDIVLMDIQMPVMNGLEATREIRKFNPGIPVVVISTYVHPDDKQRCFDAGCSSFLAKPCRRKDLLRTVNDHFLLLNVQNS